MKGGRRDGPVAELQALLDEGRLFMHAMRQAAQDLHGQGEISAGRRSVMMSLERLGPRTVPQLARSRPVSRQHMQLVVNDLVEQGLAETIPNPAHRRSRLVRLTPEGIATVRAMEARESAYLASLEMGVSRRRLKEAARTLRAVRDELLGRSAAGEPGPEERRP